jgi:dGTPase
MKIPEASPSYALPAGIAVGADGNLALRAHPEPLHPYRTPFARDGARILNARAFRRLAGKRRFFDAWLSIPLQTTFAAA